VSVFGLHEALPFFFPAVAAILGAVGASLIGLMANRLPRMHGWDRKPEAGLTLSSPPSHCDHCGEPLSVSALVPIFGWLLHDGRCPSCKNKVPWIYPAIEAICAFACAGVIAWAGPTSTAWLVMLAGAFALFCGWIDWESHEIPDGATLPLALLGMLFSPLEPDVLSRVWGAVVCGGSVLLVFNLVGDFKRVDAMSLGDVFLAGAFGAWLGVCGGLTFLIAGVVVYLAYAIPMRRKGIFWVPMGPALGIGFLLVAATGIRLV